MTDTATQEAPSAYVQLRRRQRRFVEAYVEIGNGAEAMRRIGYKGKRPDSAAYKMLQRPEVREAIEDYERIVSGEAKKRIFRTIRQLEFIESFDPRRLVGPDGEVLPLHELPEEVAAAIAGIEIEELFAGKGEKRQQIGRTRKYRIASKIDASKLLLQWKRQLSERHELTGKDGEALPRAAVYVIEKGEAAEIARNLDDKV